tara:strand:- start:1992 stop:2963 length:972 start_codon:yes stop_codon:yes gene_type:complete
MATLFGFNAFLKVAEEASWGAGAGGSTKVDIRLNSSTLQTGQERPRKTNLSVPSSGMLASTFDGFRNSGGTVDIPIQYNGSGMFFKLALGAVSTSAAAADFIHEYTPTFALPSIEIAFQRGSNLTDSSETFVGCMVSSMSVSCAAGEEMTASFDVIAEDSAARAANLTSSFPAGDSVLHFESGSLTMAGTLLPSSVEIRSFELTLDNKLERKNVLGSKLTSQPVISDVREVTMSITADVDDNNVYISQLAGTSGLVSIKFTSTAASSHYIEFQLSNAVIEDYSDSVTSFGRVERTFSVRGLASTASNGLVIEIRNGNSSAITG